MPVTDYLAFEHAASWQNVGVGENLRWVDRTQVSGLLLGNDCWLIDGQQVLFNLFDGHGWPVGKQLTDDPAITKVVAVPFEAVWERATEHAKFQLALTSRNVLVPPTPFFGLFGWIVNAALTGSGTDDPRLCAQQPWRAPDTPGATNWRSSRGSCRCVVMI